MAAEKRHRQSVKTRVARPATPPRPWRVWLSTQSLGIGGTARNLSVRVGEIPPEVEVTVVAAQSATGIHVQATQGRARVLHCPTGEALLAAMGDDPPDAFVFDVVPEYLAVLPDVRKRVKHLASMVHSLSRWSQAFLRPAAIDLCDKVVVIAEHQLAEAVAFGVPADKLLLLPNLTDLSAFRRMDKAEARDMLGLPQAAFVVGYAGRACGGKRTADLPRMLGRLRETGVNAHLALIGLTEANIGTHTKWWNMNTRAVLASIHLTRTGAHATVLSARADLAPFYSALDAFVLLSVSEGSPSVCWEALACGVPVVVTQVGDVRAFCIPQTGSVLLAGDPADPSELAVTRAVQALCAISERSAEENAGYSAFAATHVRRLRDPDAWRRAHGPALRQMIGLAP